MLSSWLVLIPVAWAAAVQPFWKSKEKVYQRVKNGEIIVSVKSVTENAAPKKNRMVVQGGGQVSAPAEFVFKTASDFENLAKMSGYIKEAKYNRDTNILAIKAGAFGYETDMKVRMKVAREEPPQNISFEVMEGPLTGFAGSFTYDSVKAEKSEVGIDGEYRYDEFPLPKMFMEFGLEVIFQRMAGSLRMYVEGEFKKKGSGGRS